MNDKIYPSLLQMGKSSEATQAKRKDIVGIDPSMLVVEEGFNVRGVGMSQEDYWAQDHVIDHVAGLFDAYLHGDYVPPLVVKFDVDSQKAIIRDGHHRYRALMQAIDFGADIKYVDVIEFKGDESKQALLMLNSANSLGLSPVEVAEIYHRLQSYGFTQAEIAEKVGKGVQHVQHMLKVYDLPIAKKQAIQRGELTVAKAIETKRDVVKREAKVAKVSASKVLLGLIVDPDTQPEDDYTVVRVPNSLIEQLKLK